MVDLKEKVEQAIGTIRPLLQQDGGDVEFVSLEEGIVKVRLKGACCGCPMAKLTLKRGVEARLKRDIPEIVSVEAV
jgi:Fe-S cluster biogenesis protein NfuA